MSKWEEKQVRPVLPLYLAAAGLFIWRLRRRIARPLEALNAAVDAQSRGEIIYLSGTELPKSFLLCESDGVGRVYVSHLAPSTLRRRVENTAAALR